jgi:DNA-binding CsgD family transcriptional regulator/tetratricopeptide (TPR) repeat protein
MSSDSWARRSSHPTKRTGVVERVPSRPIGGSDESIHNVTSRSGVAATSASSPPLEAPDITRSREQWCVGFVGRIDQLRVVAAALDAVCDGAGAALVVVEGEAGIGKSVLVDEAVRRWDSQPGRVVRRAKADELGSGSPFATVAAAVGAGDEPSAEAIVDVVAGVVGGGPMTLVIDDAHWLDAASTLLLGRLLVELADHPLAVALSIRPLPHRRELATLLAETGRRTHVLLPPMASQELEEVVAAAFGRPAEGAAPLPLDQVGGNPLYALELAAAVAAEGTTLGALAPPLSVTILRRLSYLGEATVAVLRWAALLGAAFELEDLVLAAEVSASEVVRGIDEAARAGVLRSVADELRFSHDLVRQALYDDFPAPVRRFEHARIGRALAGAGRPAITVAAHLERSATPGDAEAIRWLGDAAAEVAPRSADTAIDLLRRALALGPVEAERARLTAEISVLLGRAGRFDEVLALAPGELAKDPSPDVAVALTTSLAQAMAGRGRPADACRLLEERAVGSSVEHRARLIGMLASTRLTNGEAEAARRDAEEALAAASAAGDDHWFHSTLAVQAWLAVGAGDAAAGVDLAARSLPDGIDETDPFQSVFGRIPLGVALLERDRLDEAAASFARAIAVGDRAGAGGNVTLAHLGAALCSYAAGALDDAATAAETALALAEVGRNRSSDHYALALLARLALHRDGPTASTASAVADADAHLADTGPGLGAEAVLWVSALHAEAIGEPIALDLVLLAWQLHPLRYLLTWRLLAPDLVRWLVAAGRSAEARTVVADVAAGAGDLPGRRAIAARCAALLDAGAGAGAGADLPEEAFASPRPMEVAAARMDAARRALATTGGRDAGVAHLREAVSIAESAGAAADVVGALDLARRYRVRLDSPVRATAAGNGPTGNGLTAAERQVALLAADGLTNRAIGAELAMSRHTVDTHLRHVYRKLGLASRVELARRQSTL